MTDPKDPTTDPNPKPADDPNNKPAQDQAPKVGDEPAKEPPPNDPARGPEPA